MKILKYFILIIFSLTLLPLASVSAATNLSGRILLQVQASGEAWYVYPVNYQRYYLGRPTDAFNVMRALGLGVSNADFNSFASAVPARLYGRILLKVQDAGKAYYIDPVDHKMYYLGRPTDAFNVMRSRGLGITNTDLLKIPVASNSSASTSNASTMPTTPVLTADQKAVNFTWKYKNKSYSLSEIFSTSLYKQYINSPKVLTYFMDNPPPNPRESFYAMLISTKEGDTSVDKLITDLKSLAAKENYRGDSLIEFVLAFIQFIPYDHARASGDIKPNYPYETLYKNSGICSDKSFLADLILRRLGYGAIIFDFPEEKHTAVGIQCPIADSTYGSGYCYVETTNYFPIGFLPQTINGGVADGNTQIDKAFDTASLGRVEYYQKTSGSYYNGMTAIKQIVVSIKAMKTEIDVAVVELNSLQKNLDTAKANLDNLAAQLDNYRASGDIKNYNNLVPTYNTAADNYNNQQTAYQIKVTAYNNLVAKYNQAQADLFQD